MPKGMTPKQNVAYKNMISAMNKAMGKAYNTKVPLDDYSKEAQALIVDGFINSAGKLNANLNLTENLTGTEKFGDKIIHNIDEVIHTFETSKKLLEAIETERAKIIPSNKELSTKSEIDQLKGKRDKIAFINLQLQDGGIGNNTKTNKIISKQFNDIVNVMKNTNTKLGVDIDSFQNSIHGAMSQDINAFVADIKGQEKAIGLTGGSLFTRGFEDNILKTVLNMANDVKSKFMDKIPQYFEQFNNKASGNLAKNLLFNFSISKRQDFISVGIVVLEKDTSYGKFFEYGTEKSNKAFANIGAIQSWIEDRSANNKWKTTSTQTIKQQAFMIARSIADKGIPSSAQTSFNRAKPKNDRMIEFLMNKLLSDIKNKWEEIKTKEINKNFKETDPQFKIQGGKVYSTKKIDDTLKDLNALKKSTVLLSNTLANLKSKQSIKRSVSSTQFRSVKNTMINQLLRAKGINSNSNMKELDVAINNIRILPRNTTVEKFNKVLSNAMEKVDKFSKGI